MTATNWSGLDCSKLNIGSDYQLPVPVSANKSIADLFNGEQAATGKVPWTNQSYCLTSASSDDTDNGEGAEMVFCPVPIATMPNGDQNVTVMFHVKFSPEQVGCVVSMQKIGSLDSYSPQISLSLFIISVLSLLSIYII